MRQSYTVANKKKIARESKKVSISAAARKFKVDRKCIRTWIALDAQGAFDAQPPGRRRLDGAGRPVKCEELDALLIEEVKEERRQHRRVTRNKVVELAAGILATMDENPGLQLSDGWLECFLNRYNLVMRKVTNKPKISGAEIAARGANFIRHLRDLILAHGIEPTNIINFDETAVFAEHNKDRTLDERGATDVPVKSFGFEKVRVTAVFGARADGSKLKPCLMVKGKVSSATTEGGIPVLTNAKSWMDTESFIRYIDYMFPFVAPNTLLLVFDSARSHISKKSKAHLQARKILYAVIPGGMTAYLQPCDYGLFKPLKDTLAELIDQWKQHGPHTYTSGGNVKPPARALMIDWIKEAWSRVPEAVVRRSFRSCFMGIDSELALWRHSEYGALFQSQLGGGEPLVDELAQLIVSEAHDSDMDLDDDLEIDFA